MIHFSVPWPPTINHYYSRTRYGVVLSKRGREYRTTARDQIHQQTQQLAELLPLSGRLSVTLEFCAPDKRRRDLDNHTKAVLDALETDKHWLGIYKDDSQIDRLTLIRGATERPGCVRVCVADLLPD